MHRLKSCYPQKSGNMLQDSDRANSGIMYHILVLEVTSGICLLFFSYNKPIHNF